MTARFISFCIDNTIDLLILLLHCSYVLQPLDVGVFSRLNARLQLKPTPCLDSIQAALSV